ncbi:MAG: prepilin-type N-terminal cleavage/methylation domain-containing protein [bacterium]
MQKSKAKLGNNGFTLLEMVVAVAIFIILALLVTDIFLITTKSHRQTMEMQKVLGDARFAMETMAREIRMDSISQQDIDDYYGWPGIENPEELLPLRDIYGSLVIFKKGSGGQCPDNESSPCLLMGKDIDGDGSVEWNSITPAGVKLLHLNFYITPFSGSGSRLDQLSVTIIFASRTSQPIAGTGVPESIYLQTVATSRVYK